MEEIEEKLKLERDIIEARHQYKIIFNQLQDTKKEYHAVLAAVESKAKFLEEQKSYLAEVLKDISNARLSWAIEKDAEWQKINDKMAEAENVIKRKQELNIQEQLLRDIEQKTVEERNEQRQLELKNQQELKLLEAERKQIIEDRKKLLTSKNAFIKDKEHFKEELNNFIKECQTKF